MKALVGRLLVRWETLLVVAIIAVGIWSVTLSPFFFTRANLLDLVTPYVYIGLMAFGLAFVVITGEIDISVASILAASIVCFAQIFAAGVNVWVAALIGLAIAAGLGLVNGLLVSLLNLPSLAVTLGRIRPRFTRLNCFPARAWRRSRQASRTSAAGISRTTSFPSRCS
jgi:rhamnose transport system permease protein